MRISPMALLELDVLYEIQRIWVQSSVISGYLESKINLKICDRNFRDVVQIASTMLWTRDPFDRIITAQAAIGKNTLVTKDGMIRRKYSAALW